MAARAYLKVSYKWAEEFKAAMRGECLYKGHAVSLVPNEPPAHHVAPLPASAPRRPAGPLLGTLCRHRLGVYGGGPA